MPLYVAANSMAWKDCTRAFCYDGSRPIRTTGYKVSDRQTPHRLVSESTDFSTVF